MSAPVRNCRVIVKAPYAVGFRGTCVHIPVSAHVRFRDGKAIYSAAWLCRHVSGNVHFLADTDGRPMCKRCADLGAGPLVYRCYDHHRRLLYVGATEAWAARRSEHERRTSWWPNVADIRTEKHKSLAEAWAAEARAIKAENPVRNVRGAQRGEVAA